MPFASNFVLQSYEKDPLTQDEVDINDLIKGCVIGGLENGLNLNYSLIYCKCIEREAYSSMPLDEKQKIKSGENRGKDYAKSLLSKKREEIEVCINAEYYEIDF